MSASPLVAILNDPALRSARAEELAEALATSPAEAAAAIAAAFLALTGHPPPRDPGLALSIDDLTVLLGAPSFVCHPFHGAAPMPDREVFVMRPSLREGILQLRPDLAETEWAHWWRDQDQVALMRGSGGPLSIEHDEHGLTVRHGAGGPSVPPVGYEPPGTPGLYRASPTKQWVRIVKTGDTPGEIATMYTGSGARYMELLTANPEIPQTPPGTPIWTANFLKFNPGDALKIPQSWNVYTSTAGDWGTKGAMYPEAPVETVPLPVPPIEKGTTGSEYEAGLPDGRITAIKGELGAVGERYSGSGLKGYPGPWDFNDVIDEAFRANVKRFQLWANGQRYADGSPFSGAPSLPETGKLTEQTVTELDHWATAAAVGPTTAPGPVALPTITDPFKFSWPTTDIGGGPVGPGKELTVTGDTPYGPMKPPTAGGDDGGGALAVLLAVGAAAVFG